MHYVVVERRGHGTYWHDPEPYLAVLPSLHDALPAGARAFATDPDHFDFSALNCVKTSFSARHHRQRIRRPPSTCASTGDPSPDTTG
ncbi:hypothetical protein [Thermomonospora umbrina]|uniref:hypothetical protein n=1 Tax=Thermomonospora umbrina TaxID=111806 RepID=UPI000E23982B|nr:hypothetical protein [Thermomonospora umbrina]